MAYPLTPEQARRYALVRHPRILDDAARACHADATERQLRIVYAGAHARGRLNPDVDAARAG